MTAKLKTYLDEARLEFKRVNWPSWELTVRYTGFVIGLSVALAVFLGILDFGFLEILKLTTTQVL